MGMTLFSVSDMPMTSGMTLITVSDVPMAWARLVFIEQVIRQLVETNSTSGSSPADFGSAGE